MKRLIELSNNVVAVIHYAMVGPASYEIIANKAVTVKGGVESVTFLQGTYTLQAFTLAAYDIRLIAEAIAEINELKEEMSIEEYYS